MTTTTFDQSEPSDEDIVKLLRAEYIHADGDFYGSETQYWLYAAAADEIEKLREDVRILRTVLDITEN